MCRHTADSVVNVDDNVVVRTTRTENDRLARGARPGLRYQQSILFVLYSFLTKAKVQGGCLAEDAE